MDEKFIDVEKIIDSKNPAILKWTPKFLLNYLKKTIHQEDINKVLFENKDKFGYDFCSDIIKRFNITIEIAGTENLPKKWRLCFSRQSPSWRHGCYGYSDGHNPVQK